jgi:hypothetical protein
VGTTIIWENQDAAPHTSTSGVSPNKDGIWDSGILNKGQTFELTFQDAGSFAYFCTVHPSMTATISVTDETPALPTPAPPTQIPPTPAPSASAQSVTVGPTKDNTLYSSSTGSVSNGAGMYMFAGNTASGAARRALVAFDLSAIPNGATINSVTLSLEMTQTATGGQNMALHKLTSDWGEGASVAGGNQGRGTTSLTGDATWIHAFFATAMWNSVGGDFESGVSASTVVAGQGQYQWSSDQMTADVQSWIHDPESNFGWILIGQEGSPKTAKRFDTKESSESSRPTLTIEFTP